jgi:hypothetical protein
MSDESAKKTVVIEPHAFACMVAYAARHSTSVVHGAVVGSASETELSVSSVFPICHDETPTKPLIDTALAMVASTLDGDESKKIIGWFTAPELLEDLQAGPVALRIVANLDGDSADKVLLVLRNQEVGDIVNNESTKASSVVGAFGKDFGSQWMEPLEVTVSNEVDAAGSARKEYESTTAVTDLVDHWKSVTTSEWSQAAHVCT